MLEELESRTVPSVLMPSHEIQPERLPQSAASDIGRHDHGTENLRTFRGDDGVGDRTTRTDHQAIDRVLGLPNGARAAVTPGSSPRGETGGGIRSGREGLSRLDNSFETAAVSSREVFEPVNRTQFPLQNAVPGRQPTSSVITEAPTGRAVDRRAEPEPVSSIVALVASLPQPALVVGVSSTSILIAVSAAPAAVTPIVVVASDESAGAEVTVAVPADPSDSVPAIRVIHARGIVQSADSPPARAAEPAELRSGRADTTLAAMDFDASRDGETSLCNLDPTRLAARVGLVLAERAVEAAARIDAVLSPAPIVYGLLTNVVAVDLPSLELGVQRLIEEVEEIGDEVADTLTGVPVTTWLTVFAVSAAAIEGVRLIVRRSRGRPVLAVGPGGEPSSWPESVGRPPEDLP